MDTKSNISFDQGYLNKYNINFAENISDFNNYDSFIETEKS